MELPIQLKFFKKIELYQEFKFQDEKAEEASEGILRKLWKTEKRVLRWTARHHHCLGSSIDHDYIRNNILGENNREKYD